MSPDARPPTKNRKRAAWLVATGPFATFFVLYALVGIVWRTAVPPARYTGGSALGNLIWHNDQLWAPMRRSQSEAVLTRTEDGAFMVIPLSPNTKFYERLAENQVFISYRPVEEASGILEVTRLRRHHVFEFTGGTGLTPAERALARAVFFDEVVRPFSILDPESIERLPIRDIRESRTVWSGYLVDLVFLLLLAWLPVSLAWIGRTPAYWQKRLAARRRARGLCPSCGYNRTGLPPETPCPECGTSR